MWLQQSKSKHNKRKKLYKVSFPTLNKRIGVPVVVEAYQKHWLDKLLSGNAKQGKAELFEKRNRWYMAVSLSFEAELESSSTELINDKVMGIDVGLRQLAVATIGTSTSFFSGKELGYKRRRFASRRRKLGQAKKLSAIRRSKDKESRWIKDANHKISRQIVNMALENGVHLIRMEDLTGIRHSAKSPKEAGRNLHRWAHGQLQGFIQYKAEMEGIELEYVNPTYTSQMCKNGHVDKRNRKGSRFRCIQCGYSSHADVNASINIAKAISGISEKKAS